MKNSSIFLSESELITLLPDWVKSAKAVEEHSQVLNKQSSALIVIDMQDDFLFPRGGQALWGGQVIIPRVKQLIDYYRQNKLPVIFTRQCYKNAEIDGGKTGKWWGLDRDSIFLKDGLPNAAITSELLPLADENIISKQRYDAFYSTNLELLLKKYGSTDLVITGVASNCCCAATAHDGFFRDFNIFFTADGTGGSDEQAHKSVLLDIARYYGTVLTCEDVIRD